MHRQPLPPSRPRQRGIALFVVIAFVLLSMLLALWASRTSLFHEMTLGNDADYQRAFEAAQALLQDAELDVRGENPDGSPCTPNADVCRQTTLDKIPLEAKDVGPLLATLGNLTAQCRNGLCAKRLGRQDFWNYNSSTSPTPTNLQPGEVPLEQLATSGIGARYGQYTGATNTTTNGALNPILADRSDDKRGGWYWIEVLPYNDSSKNSGLIVGGSQNLLTLNLTPSVVYRITALAYGLKPSTMVVLQETYAQQKRKD